MAFFFLTLVFMYIGRKLGWALSKLVLYLAPTGVAILGCAVWGGAVALGVRALICWQHPGILLTLVMGYALGAYVAIPNFGLVHESSIPYHAQPRHQLVSNVPLLAYIVASVGLAFLFRPS